MSYICSTNSNIPMIRRRYATIAEKFGKEVTFEDRVYYTFPEPDALSCSGKDALADCRLITPCGMFSVLPAILPT